MKIYSATLNIHDHNTYDGVYHNQRERHTRFKHNVPKHFDAYEDQAAFNLEDRHLIDDFYNNYFKHKKEILSFTMTKGVLSEKFNIKNILEFKDFRPKNLWDYYLKDNLYFIDHHQSHATYAFINSKFTESDILVMDNIGYKFRSIFVKKDGTIIDLSDKLKLGKLWEDMSKLTGFGPFGASKLMGLAGYGQYSEKFYNYFEDKKCILYEHFEKNLLAFSLQKFTIDKIKEHVLPLKTSDNICVSGGVAYNGYMNEELTKHYKNVFVPPAVGDEGQAIGAYQHADYMLNNNKHIAKTFSGKEYDYVGEKKVNYKDIAQSIADGCVVGWFQGKSESGNRALGNRSILADPRNPDIKDYINETIKKREDFRPFAPAVLEEHYKEYFDTNQPSPYMSRICKVKSNKIPGVTHVDNTARIQTVNKNFNEKFYNIINEFYKITGIPMLLNTSFNCQEPIVETPEDAIYTFKNTALDILVINDYVLNK